MENNKNKINWTILSINPKIYIYDYEDIKKRFNKIGDEIIEKALSPDRLFKLMEKYGKEEVMKCYFDSNT
jgi:hypothetical protein